jgi:ribonuclease HI
VRGALCYVLEVTLDPTSAEAYAAWKMACFISQLRLCTIMVESDSLEIVNALRNVDTCRGRYGFILEDAKQLLNSSRHWEAHHVRRTGNEAVHSLARHALSNRTEQV